MSHADQVEKGADVPTILIIFGGTGDLAKRKLAPSIMDLFVKGLFPHTFRIVGFSRKDHSHDVYRSFFREAINAKAHGHGNADVDTVLSNVFYVQGEFHNREDYSKLHTFLTALDQDIGQCTNKLFYLAVPPRSYETIFSHLAASDLTKSCGGDLGWTRILVEKPFGSDLSSAGELDKKLGKLFKEEQIFRIDHYLAKDAIQNILTFRFANTLLEDSWNRDHVDRVHIKLYETRGVEGRGAFFDSIGAFRDVGQNHMLQMLALIAMGHPGTLSPDSLRDARAKLLQDLHSFSEGEVQRHTLSGQYEGYREVENVTPDSATETYFLVRAFVENERWRGVPFYLESGKALSEDRTEIEVYFKSPDPCMCGDREPHDHRNKLTLSIAPVERIVMQFWTKKPGVTYELEPQELSFEYQSARSLPDAYEKVLYDCIAGDQTLFTSSEEVKAAWKFIMPILTAWREAAPLPYKRGSCGPKDRSALLA